MEALPNRSYYLLNLYLIYMICFLIQKLQVSSNSKISILFSKHFFPYFRSIQPIPNALQFRTNFKLVCIAQYLKKSSNTNNDQDDREFLGDLLDFSKFQQISYESKDFDSPEIALGNTEQNCLYNIAGTYN